MFIVISDNKIWEQMNLEGRVDTAGGWDTIITSELPKKHQMTQKPQVLFEKVTDDLLAQYKEKTKEVKPLTSYFGKEDSKSSEDNF